MKAKIYFKFFVQNFYYDNTKRKDLYFHKIVLNLEYIYICIYYCYYKLLKLIISYFMSKYKSTINQMEIYFKHARF
jgi:hypothetical protein